MSGMTTAQFHDELATENIGRIEAAFLKATREEMEEPVILVTEANCGECQRIIDGLGQGEDVAQVRGIVEKIAALPFRVLAVPLRAVKEGLAKVVPVVTGLLEEPIEDDGFRVLIVAGDEISMSPRPKVYEDE